MRITEERARALGVVMRELGGRRPGIPPAPLVKGGQRNPYYTHGVKGMNQTEARFAERLELLRKAGYVKAWWFEPVSMKLRIGSRYRADFVVYYDDGRVEFVEVKGGRGFTEASLLRFKAAREEFSCWTFSAWQWKKGEWRQVY